MGYELDNRLSVMSWEDLSVLVHGEGEQLELPFLPISIEDDNAQD